MKNTIDINCDLGEGMEQDEVLMKFISSANIACGFHAGDVDTIKRTVDLCIENNVAIGAHPSFDDRQNFGRTEMKLPADELYDLVSTQLMIMEKAAAGAGGTLVHVKPHGALYNMAARDQEMSSIIVRAIKDFNESLIVFGLSGSHLVSEAKQAGLRAAHEVFADRTYQDDGHLTPRTLKNAFIENVAEIEKHILSMVRDGRVHSTSGKQIPIEVDTICLHGDGVHAVEFAEVLNVFLVREGIHMESLK